MTNQDPPIAASPAIVPATPPFSTAQAAATSADTDARSLMRLAMAEARRASGRGEVPIGCVVRHDPTGRIIGTGHNLRETERDPTAHAEIVALREAARVLGHWRALDCTLVVTLEPCPMCAGAIVAARVPRLIYGCADPKAGAVRTLYTLCEDPRLNHRVAVTPDVLADECTELLREFFRLKRAAGQRGRRRSGAGMTPELGAGAGEGQNA